MLRPVVVSLLAALSLTGVAQAATLHSHSITSVNGKMSCYLSKPADGGGIWCTSPAVGVKGKTPVYLHLNATGKTTTKARSDFGGYAGRARTFRTGDRWALKGITCTYGSMGINCNNRDDHGFRFDEVSVKRH